MSKHLSTKENYGHQKLTPNGKLLVMSLAAQMGMSKNDCEKYR